MTTETTATALLEAISRLESKMDAILSREAVKDWYTTEEFGKMVGKAEITVREWCRRGRIKGVKRQNKRGKYSGWAVSHDELVRYRRDGLYPDLAVQTRIG